APDVTGTPIEIALHCTGDAAQTAFADPPAILLGEVRTATTVKPTIGILHPGASIAVSSADLEAPVAGLSVMGAPATTPAVITLTAAPTLEGRLDGQIIVKHAAGSPLAIAVSGAAVGTNYSAPSAVSLGAFCVQQPTTPR